MKMNYFKTTTLFLAAAALILSFGSCTKDSDDDGGGSGSTSKTGLLTSGGWVITSVVLAQGTTSADYFDFFDDCEKDDITIFNANNSMTYDEGATKCDPSDPQAVTEDIWSLVSNDTKLSIVYNDGSTDLMDILTLSSSELRITYTEDDPTSNDDLITTITFKHN